MEKIILYNKKEECFGCEACKNVCSQNAITMKEDEYGFAYPFVDGGKCIACGACKKVCPIGKAVGVEPSAVFAAAAKERKEVLTSSSGGIFPLLAKNVIESGGCVFGSVFEYDGCNVKAVHRAAKTHSEMQAFKGSKYVQSHINFTYKSVEKELKTGKNVLFGGTPCQTAGLLSFLGKNYPNLIAVDLVCHGVPSQKLFNEYLAFILENKNCKRIDKFTFRDKTRFFGKGICMEYTKNSGKNARLYIAPKLSSYFTLFYGGYLSRKSCYACPYAGKLRVGDITLGDFQKISKVHSHKFPKNMGVSCVLINSPKGKAAFDKINGEVQLFSSSYDKAARYNSQLNRPVKLPQNIVTLQGMYAKEGYLGAEKFYSKTYRISIILHSVLNRLPRCIRRFIYSH